MERNNYYSQSEIIKLFKISINKFKKLIIDYNLQPIHKEIELRNNEGLPYTVRTIYIEKDIIEELLTKEGIIRR